MTTALKVDGMNCQHCVRAVTAALVAVPGASDALVSLETGLARVEGEVEPAALIRAVQEAGYQVTLVTS